MEVLTAILIGVIVFILSALIIYCSSAFSMREKTFEEVIAEQKRREEEEREKAKAEKKAEREQLKKKFKKGKHDKVKEKAAQVTEPELKAEHKMVNLEIEPEIIEPTESLGLSAGVRHRGKKDKAAKSILQNKGEHTPVAEKAAEIHHKPLVPKDELELKKIHEKEKVQEKVVVVEKIEKVKTIHTESHEKELKSKHSTDIKENLPPSKKVEKDDGDKRSGKTKSTSEDVSLNGSKLISSVKTAKLSDNEVQTLIDILLNRQGLTPTGPVASESWNKKSQKGDPMLLLKKQLEEKEKAFQEEQNMAMTANTRVRELKNELMAEKNKYTSLEKRYQEKIGQQQAEMDALQQRMQHTHDQHLHETSNLQARVRQLEQGGDRATAHKLTEENKILQENFALKVKEIVSLNDQIKHFEKELKSNVNKFQTSEGAKKNLESKINAYEDKIRTLEASQKDVDSMIAKRMEEVSQELRKAEATNTSLSTDLQKANGALSTAQGEVSTLKGKLQELEAHLSRADASKEAEARLQESERRRSDLEGNVRNLEKQLADLSQRLGESETETMRLLQENKTLSDENKTMNDRLQSAPASNGDIHENGPTVSLAEHERLLSEKSSEVNELTSNVESQKKTLSTLQAELDTKDAQVADLQQQLTQQKAKNNELREKNWKAMEALEKSEKSSAEKVDKALKSARELSSAGITEIETYDKSVFQRLFPDVQVSDKLPHREWLVAFEKQALKKIPSKADTDKVAALATENERLKSDLEALRNNLSLKNANEEQSKKWEEANQKLLRQVEDYEKQVTELNSKSERLIRVEEENQLLKSSQSSTSASDAENYMQLEKENARLKSEVDNYQGIVSETENKVRQLEKSIEAEEKVWQEKLKQALSESSQDPSAQQRIAELESLATQQENQMQEYRRILSVTEGSLNQLESKLSAEEASWRDQLQAVQSELSQTKKELSSLKQELQVSRGSQEMQTRVAELESELREAQEKVIVITREKETVINQFQESKQQISSVEIESLQQQLSEIRIQLETERKKNKELSLNIVKLNGIIKTGQDALTQEQNLVKKLQESLDSKSMSSGVSELEEVEQLRSKLSDKQKLLEREMAVNKQLSERLATSSKDNGTSV